MMVYLFRASLSPSCACIALRKSAIDGKTDETAEAANTILQNLHGRLLEICSLRGCSNKMITKSNVGLFHRQISFDKVGQQQQGNPVIIAINGMNKGSQGLKFQ